MEAEIRMAESGYSYHYSNLTTVHALMHEIRKGFKLELEDQKIITKNGQLLKSTMAFDSIQQTMKKTIPTNNSNPFNPVKSPQIKQIQCLYIYNQKELLKPIEQKPFDDQFYLKLLRQKCKEMSSLAQNSYEFKQFNEKITQKNIIPMIESITKRLKIPFENITHRYSKFYENLNQRNYYKLQISSLLDLIQNQDKARKLLVKNVEVIHDRRAKKKLLSLREKILKETQKQNQMSMKENSSFFSSQKNSHCSDNLTQLARVFTDIENKNSQFFQRLKQSKKQVTKGKFLQQERITFQIDKKVTVIEKEYEENARFIKEYFEQFCEEIIKVNAMLSKNKESKDVIKQLMFINEKIVGFEKKIEENIKEFTQMYLELTKIHVKSETQNIKMVFSIYVELVKAYEELETDVRKFEKEFTQYRDEKSQQEVKISEFSQSRNNNLPLKKQIRSPKKQENNQKRLQKQDSSISKQLESNMPKINSPIKNKICKNSLKSFNDQLTSKNLQAAIKENKQLSRRLEFNRRLQGLVKYCKDLCDREQEMRKSFINSKEFEDNKVDLLAVLNVPRIQINYNETSDAELTQTYKKWIKDNSMAYDNEVNWEMEMIGTSNFLSTALNAYLGSKSDASEREKSMEKILGAMSDTFYKMMKGKIEKQVELLRKTVSKEVRNENKQLIDSLIRSNDDLQEEVSKLQEQLTKIKEQNKSSLESLEQSVSPQTYQMLQSKYHDLMSNYRSLEEQNEAFKAQTKSLEAQLLDYQEQVKQTTQKLIESYEESNASEVQKLNSELKAQKEQTLSLRKQMKEVRSELQVGKKNLLKQLQNIQNLFEKITELTEEKDFYERQFAQLKNLLADKEVAIIKLQKQLEANKKQLESHNNQDKPSKKKPFEENEHDSNAQPEHQCECSQEVALLKQKNQDLEEEVQSLDRQLKEILYKEMIEQETQTEGESLYEEEGRIKMGKENLFVESVVEENKETYKIGAQQKAPNQNPMINELATKQAHLNNFNISHEQNFHTEQQAISHYYVSSMGQQWVTSVFSKFSHLSIGKTIEQGMYHIFLPFSNDIYIGVTANDEAKNFTSYQDYVNHESSNMVERIARQPIYILDLKEFNLRTNQMLRECSLVLVVKVERKDQISMGNKVMVSGKIQFALGFQDDDMVIKNYSHFLQE